MTAERVDLDAVQARDERANKPPYSVRDIAESQADVADLVAELRAAREAQTQIRQLVDAAEFLIRNDKTAQPQFVLAELAMDIRGVLVTDRHDPPAAHQPGGEHG